MREHTQSFDGSKVDLDDPKTYEYLPNTQKELETLMFCEIGKALCYMDHLDSRKGLFSKRKEKDRFVEHQGVQLEMSNSGYYQRQRIYKLINNFSNNRHHNFKNLLWFKEQIFLFQDETENMC